MHHSHTRGSSHSSNHASDKVLPDTETTGSLAVNSVGNPGEASQPDVIRAAFAEFFSMLIFVFAGEGSGMAYNKLTDNGPATPAGLIVASLSHAFSLSVAVSVGANISGGHVNPAVTFGAFIGGNITLLRVILYWIAQLLGSVAACLLLKYATGGLVLL
ncbi:hypothetical protein L6164_008876 [Bauhinia variegata]|uniref:Uncharacterized protein n=1 Tax=Bauhinia variegata TaxID=167791 RepID=A0ACB9PI26_BAUVA|nr:hypothetical protein L6164_008876 [Bauhinia variegata]